jgi:hypothetical protein
MLLRFALVFLVLFLVITTNLPSSVVAQMGFEPNYLLGALVAFVVTGLVAHHRIALIVVVVALAIGANLPEEVAGRLHVDRTVLLATLVALLLAPRIIRWFD